LSRITLDRGAAFEGCRHWAEFNRNLAFDLLRRFAVDLSAGQTTRDSF
jgi:hypothetical protein